MASIAYIVVRIIMVPGGVQTDGERPKVNIYQCFCNVAGSFNMFLPGIISRKFSIQISQYVYHVRIILLRYLPGRGIRAFTISSSIGMHFCMASAAPCLSAWLHLLHS